MTIATLAGVFGERVAQFRIEAGATQTELGEYFEKGQSLISKIERGEYGPMRFYERLAEYFGRDACDLFFDPKASVKDGLRGAIGDMPASSAPLLRELLAFIQELNQLKMAEAISVVRNCRAQLQLAPEQIDGAKRRGA